ncbi:MAG: hypothetical protein KJO18_05500 [Acidimicrobiia bacterium]|nr:hypothetical protein [Acidimicrobiia bacterium]
MLRRVCLLPVAGQQLERVGREPAIDQVTGHTRASYGVAEAVGRVGVAMIVDACAIDEVRVAVDPNRKVTARARKPELALPARRLDD